MFVCEDILSEMIRFRSQLIVYEDEVCVVKR
jgi:hypothetical protein